MAAVIEPDIITVIKQRLSAVLVDGLELDEARDMAVDHTLPTRYAELHLTFESHGATLLAGYSDLDGYVLATRACAKTIRDMQVVRRRVRDVIYANPIVVGTATSTPPQCLPGEMGDQDAEGYYTAYDEFTFTFD